MTIEPQESVIEENLAALDGERFKAHYDWIDETAIETYAGVVNTRAAFADAFSRRMDQAGETRGNSRNKIIRLIYLRRPEHLAQGELGRALNVTSANVTYLIDGLVREGLVTRLINPVDRRVTFVELTPEGEVLAQRIVPFTGKGMMEIASCLTREERVTLNALLDRLRINAETLYLA